MVASRASSSLEDRQQHEVTNESKGAAIEVGKGIWL